MGSGQMGSGQSHVESVQLRGAPLYWIEYHLYNLIFTTTGSKNSIWPIVFDETGLI
jgi:hypothetical protein